MAGKKMAGVVMVSSMAVLPVDWSTSDGSWV
jgi:hypothetical protein